MIALLVLAAVAALPTGDDRLMTGSKWQCAATLPDDHYAAIFVVEQGRSATEKKLRVISATGGIPPAGVGFGLLRADRFNKNGSDLIAEFGQGFSNYGLWLLAQWDKSDEVISLHVRAWNAAAKSFEEKNEKSYLLTCRSLSAGENA